MKQCDSPRPTRQIQAILIGIGLSLTSPWTAHAAEDAATVISNGDDAVIVNASTAIPDNQRHQPHSTRPNDLFRRPKRMSTRAGRSKNGNT